jgi:hypothetical protein
MVSLWKWRTILTVPLSISNGIYRFDHLVVSLEQNTTFKCNKNESNVYSTIICTTCDIRSIH